MNANQVTNFLLTRQHVAHIADELRQELGEEQPTNANPVVHFWDFDEETEVADYNERLTESEAA